MLNGQTALGRGICDITPIGTYNLAALTGATANLGNSSGAAAQTIFEKNGTITTYSEDGQTAISYRGVENPWGNIWKMVGGITIYGKGINKGGIPYICNDYNYSYNNKLSNYTSANFCLPNKEGWISNLGYGEPDSDWLLMPSDNNTDANSAVPIGDNGWFIQDLNSVRMVVIGGSWSFGDSNGPFYYGCDKVPTDSTYKAYGTRLIYIPTKNATYNNNITKWEQYIGG